MATNNKVINILSILAPSILCAGSCFPMLFRQAALKIHVYSGKMGAAGYFPLGMTAIIAQKLFDVKLLLW